MPIVLTTMSLVTCPHGGQVFAVGGQSRVTVDGASVLTGGQAFTVTGCIGGVLGLGSCDSVEWVGLSTRVTVSGHPVLLQSSSGTVLSGGRVQGRAVVVPNLALVHAL